MITYHDGVGAGGHRDLRVLDILNAFEDELAAPFVLDPVDVAPIERRIELAGRPLGKRHDAFGAFHMADDIAEELALGAEHAKPPANLRQ